MTGSLTRAKSRDTLLHPQNRTTEWRNPPAVDGGFPGVVGDGGDRLGPQLRKNPLKLPLIRASWGAKSLTNRGKKMKILKDSVCGEN
jgi:hypothetical protein